MCLFILCTLGLLLLPIQDGRTGLQKDYQKLCSDWVISQTDFISVYESSKSDEKCWYHIFFYGFLKCIYLGVSCSYISYSRLTVSLLPSGICGKKTKKLT